MTQEHKDALIDKCSKYKDAAMPVFSESPAKGETALSTALANTITPPPNSGVFATQNKDPNKGKSTITPIPAAMELESQKPDAIKKPAASAKPSKAQLEIHRKWQAAAEAAGGSDTRIVLSKPAAKKIIYDFLYDAFRPMNITEIHKVRSKNQSIVETSIAEAEMKSTARLCANTFFHNSSLFFSHHRVSKQSCPVRS